MTNPNLIRDAAVTTLLKAFESTDKMPDHDKRRTFIKAQNEATMFFLVTRELASRGVRYKTTDVEGITNTLLSALGAAIENLQRSN